MALALAAQFSFEPSPGRDWKGGLFLYILAAAWLVYANRRGEIRLPALPRPASRIDPLTIRWPLLAAGAVLAAFAFLTFGGNQFNDINLTLWLACLALFIAGLWLPATSLRQWLAGRLAALRRWDRSIRLTRWGLLVLAVAAISIFFRFFRLASVPPEMFSDHAEKLLDVWDVLHGQARIFFPRNTGREALQFYLTAAIVRYLGVYYSFLSLKIGTAIFGLLMLPFIYLLGKEMGSRRAGLLAALLAGVAYWPNVLARDALRFILYPAFVAPTLYFLLRGLRTGRRNDFILSGLALGIGLHGYTPIRILPFVIVIAVGLYLLHRLARGRRSETVFHLLVLALIAFLVFLPLARYALSNPEVFGYRAFTRLGSLEQPLPGSPVSIFLHNLWRAVTMFAWDDGEIWVNSVVHRPALDLVSAALFHLGVVLLLVRYLRRRTWQDLFLLLAVPLLMLPSILSLAFPNENPALNRAGGALVPVFVIAGLSFDSLLAALATRLDSRRWLAGAVAALLLVLAVAQNFDLVFRQFHDQFAANSWNTSEMGQVIRDYASSIGSLDSAWVVPYPYWVDTRLVGINAGNPTRDYALFPEQLPDSQAVPGPKLFILNLADAASLDALKSLYPQGWQQEYISKYENKNFLIYIVPPSG